MGDEVKEYYIMALNMFEASYKKDVALGMTKSTEYATKLDGTAYCHYRLGHIEEAIATMQEYVEANTATFPNRKLSAYYRAGKSFMDWRLRHDDKGINRRLVIEAERCFSKVTDTLINCPSADLCHTDKVKFIEYYLMLSKDLPKKRMKSVERFCQSYDQCKLCTSDSSTSSGERTSSSDSPESHSDESREWEDETGLEQRIGIPFADSEKIESAQFEKDFLAEIDSKLTVGKRHRSSSD